MLSLSSLGVVAKVLVDEGRLRETVGVQMFTAVIIAELLALFVVGFAISEHGGTEAHLYEMNLTDVARIIGEIFLFAAATWFLSATILRKLIVLLQGIPGCATSVFRFAAGRTLPCGRGHGRGRPSRFPWRAALRRRAFQPCPTRCDAT